MSHDTQVLIEAVAVFMDGDRNLNGQASPFYCRNLNGLRPRSTIWRPFYCQETVLLVVRKLPAYSWRRASMGSSRAAFIAG